MPQHTIPLKLWLQAGQGALWYKKPLELTKTEHMSIEVFFSWAIKNFCIKKNHIIFNGAQFFIFCTEGVWP